MIEIVHSEEGIEVHNSIKNYLDRLNQREDKVWFNGLFLRYLESPTTRNNDPVRMS